MLTTSETIDKAADELMIRGWTRGGTGWLYAGSLENQAVCIEGALMAVTGDRVKNGDLPQKFLECPAYRAVDRYLKLHREYDKGCHTTFIWNDHQATDIDDVLDVLRSAAKIEREKECLTK